MIKKIFSVKANDADVLNKSSSGGAFSLLCSGADVIFGAAWDKGFKSVSLSEADVAEPFRGSKYLRADIRGSFENAKKRLEEGKTVLFSASPCQIAALKKHIPESLSGNLVTVDFICHGVPKSEVWEKYLAAREKEFGAEAVGISFRNKDEGWRKYALKIDFANGKTYRKRAAEDPYLRGYVANLFLSDGCERCPFKNDGYESDITLGDFWGAESEEGVSLAVCHTEKGVALVKRIENAEVSEVGQDEALKKNPSYFAPSKPNVLRSRFLSEIGKKDVERVLKKYTSPSKFSRIRLKLLKIAEGKKWK